MNDNGRIPCIMLAVDVATRSGWAIYSAGVRLHSGECNISDRVAVRGACDAAVKWRGELPTVLVLERPWGARRNVTATLMALGAARQVWLEEWAAANGRKRPPRVVKFLPSEWQGPLGLRGKVAPEMQLALLKAHDLDYPHRTVGADEFDALMMGLVATRSARVAAVLPKPRRKAA